MPDLIDRLRPHLEDRYVLERELGRGGMATVFLATDLKHDRKVAVKVVHPEIAATLGTERFLQEIRIAAQLEHPHILSLHDSGEADGLPYYVMPYVEGESLQERLQREGPLQADEAVRVTLQVANGLEYAHRRGVVHRDIKPANILLLDNHAVIADFGVARAVGAASSSQMTATGFAVGTPAYMSPEQAVGDQDLDGRTDIYALGCVLFEMLAGTPAYEGATPIAILARKATGETPDIRERDRTVPAHIAAALASALALEPGDRFETAEEFGRALEGARPVKWRPARGGFRQKVGYVAAVVALAVASVWGAGRFRTGGDSGIAASLAVLPFQASAERDDIELIRNIADDLRDALVRIASVRGVSRASTDNLEPDIGPQEAGQQLGVDAVLWASVRPAGESVVLNTELIDVATGSPQWSETFPIKVGSTSDLYLVEDSILRSIARTLELPLETGEESVVRRQTQNLQAYALYQQGRKVFDFTMQALDESLGYFEQAVQLDPDYAQAHAAIAETWANKTQIAPLYPREGWPHARDAARRALELDETLPLAHSVLADFDMYYNYDWYNAEQQARLAVEFGPGDPGAHVILGQILDAGGRRDEALAELRRAVELDPTNAFYSANLASRLATYGHLPEGVAEFERAMELDPENWVVWWCIVDLHLMRGDTVAVIADFEKALRLPGSPSDMLRATLGYWYGAAGRNDEARAILASLEAEADSTYVPTSHLLEVRLGLGDTAAVYPLLERAFDERDYYVGWYLAVDPRFEAIRQDPRGQALLRQIGLPEASN